MLLYVHRKRRFIRDGAQDWAGLSGGGEGGMEGVGVGGWGVGVYIPIATVTTRMTPALRWAAMRDIFNVSLIVRDKVTRQCPQTTTFEEKGQPKRTHSLTDSLNRTVG